MTLPGRAIATPSSLLICKSGEASTGVLLVALLLPESMSGPLLPSSPIEAELSMKKTSKPTALSTSTAKSTWPPLPLDTAPMASVHVLPALPSGEQAQPDVLAAALNVVSAGTMSVISTPVAVVKPSFV